MGKWKRYAIGRYTLQQLNGVACAVWKENGKRRRFRLGVRTEPDGRAALARFASVEAASRVSAKTVGEIFSAYVADRERDGKLVRVFHDNWRALKGTFQAMPPEAINADVCRAYAEERFAAGRARATVWSELTRLRSCLNWAHKRKVIPEAPYVWIPSKGHPRNKVLSEPEFLKLLNAAGMPHVRLFMILCLATAGRKGAVLELTWDRVDFEAGEIDLKRPETLAPMSKAARKGRACVPMNGLARAALQEARQAALSDHVIEWNGEPVANVGKAFRAAAARAGLEGVTPHTIRHTAGTWAWEETDPAKVARFLGHRNARTTEAIYAHPSVGFASDAARAVDLKVVRSK
jgi:integrase